MIWKTFVEIQKLILWVKKVINGEEKDMLSKYIFLEQFRSFIVI